MTARSAPAPSKPQRLLKQAIWGSAIAFVIHLLPFLWLNEEPESRLVRARDTQDLVKRAEILRPLETDDRSTPAQLRDGASLLLQAGASGDARYLAEEAVRREPQAFENQLLLTKIFALERMPQALERTVASAARLKPEDPRPVLELAKFHEREGELQEAIAALQLARARAPRSNEVLVGLSRLLIETNALADAEELVSQSIPEQESAELLVALGVLRLRQGRLTEALNVLQRAVGADPELAEGHFFLGTVLFQRANVKAAEEHFRIAGKLAPEDLRPLAALCALQAETGRIEAARAIGNELRRRFPFKLASIPVACRGG